MKKKLLALALVLVMLLGCMSVTAFGTTDSYNITLDQTSITLAVGETKVLKPTVTNMTTGADSTAVCTPFISWKIEDGSEYASVANGKVTAIKEGTAKVCVTFSQTGIEAKAYCEVTVVSGTAKLDGDTTTKNDIEQKYTFTQKSGTETTYTDVTKVKVEWTLTDIAANFTSEKTWDPDTLAWKETKTVADIADKTAEFTLTNYSSKSVRGIVSFEAEKALNDTLTSVAFDDNNGKEIDTVVNADYTIDETKKTNVPSNTITATLTFNKDSFADLTATASATKYGTYTVTIKNAKLTQTAPAAPSKDDATITSNSVTLTAASAGQGDTKYGYSTSNDATTVKWQDDVEFTELAADTAYYFFVKYEENDDYKEAVSEGTEIKTKASSFAIINSLTYAVADTSNAATINPNGSVTLTYTPTGAYSLPTNKDDITVTGATIVSWTVKTTTTKLDNGALSGETCKNTSAELVIKNPTGDVSITIIAGNTPTVTATRTSDYADYYLDGSVVATGKDLTYQWYISNKSDGPYEAINNAVSSAYSQTGLQDDTAYFFKCRVYNKYGYTDSSKFNVLPGA